jgi:hypothetical protein
MTENDYGAAMIRTLAELLRYALDYPGSSGRVALCVMQNTAMIVDSDADQS